MKAEVSTQGDLSCFTEAKGCAVIGASSSPVKAGYQILENMITAGYPHPIAPVNPSGGEILGRKVYAGLPEIEHPVELVIIATPAKATPAVVGQLEKRMELYGDVKSIVCTAAGFAEVHTEEGTALQELLVDFCRRHGIRMLGPNCVGLIDVKAGIDTTFIADISHIPGGISFVSQSGAVGAWLLMSWTATPGARVGFHRFLTVGNMADVDIIEALSFAGESDETSVLGLYIEGSPRARTLVETLGRTARKKPVVAIKVGRTEEGAKAAESHTGSMAGSDALYDAAFRQYGIIRVDSIDELSDTMRAFDAFGTRTGKRVFVLTQAGGPGIFCVDEIYRQKVFSPAIISTESRETLRKILPPIASICNPDGHADITAAADSAQHVDALEVVLRDPGVDAVLFITTATLFLDLEDMGTRIADLTARLKDEGNLKPILPVILSGNWVTPCRRLIEQGGVPTFDTPDRAVRALANLVRYSSFRTRTDNDENNG